VRTIPSVPKLSQELVPFEGGPMDGQAMMLRPPLRPHVYWKNRNGTYEVYLLKQSVYGWTYHHEPNAEVIGRPRLPIEPDDLR